MSASTANSGSFTRNKHSMDNRSIEITKEEFERISDAFKKEEFRKLFFEYCDEIQDPENRKRYESEIIQLEAERGVDVTFVHPEPGFVIKTSVDGKLKCFINVAKCPEIAKPTNETCLDNLTGKRGLNWALPMVQAGPRDDLDAQGKYCRVYDVIFHPDAFDMAQCSSMFRKCLIDTALDAVEREYQVNLDRVNLKFPKLDFKGMSRPTVIRKLAKNPPAEASEPHPLETIYPPRPPAKSPTTKSHPIDTKKTKQAEFATPKYTIKHRRDVDLSEYTNELDAKLNVTVPRELVVEIELPLLKSTGDSQLDVTAKTLYLHSDRPGAKYRLKLDLPYTIDDKRGNARFDVETRRLFITLPVVQQSPETERIMHEKLMHLNREDSGVESDIRDDLNSNSESPVEELSDSLEEHSTESEAKNEDAVTSPPCDDAPAKPVTTFLKTSIHYQFPSKFDCNVLDNVMSLVLHVRNVQQESISFIKELKSVHMQFTSIGSGYYPTYYAFYIQLPEDTNIEIQSAEPEAWENNVVLNLNLTAPSENLHSYLAGLDSNDLKEYMVQGKFKVAHHSRQRKPSTSPAVSLASSLDISVERSDCERSVEIEIKPREQQSTGGANTTEDEEPNRADYQQSQKKVNKKQKKKNKKRRSLSESVCDDIKAYQQHQQQQQNVLESPSQSKDGQKKTVSSSVAVPNSNLSQQRKQRSYSECRDSISDGNSTMPTSFKGILKHYSRYDPRPSISDSCSSIDECSSYSPSITEGADLSIRFSKSFSDIPEENVAVDGLSESCKKTVRFNEVIMKQVFRLDSSILGQRKKNQKRRDRKQRALQRRLSEGDSADYEDNKPASLPSEPQYFKPKSNTIKVSYEDPNKKLHNVQNRNMKLNNGKIDEDEGGNAGGRLRLESESSSDIDASKGTMMFEMDM